MKRVLLSAGVVALLTVSGIGVAQAHRVFVHKDGRTADVNCSKRACTTKYISKSGKVTRTTKSAGWKSGFKALKKKLNAKGYH